MHWVALNLGKKTKKQNQNKKNLKFEKQYLASLLILTNVQMVVKHIFTPS